MEDVSGGCVICAKWRHCSNTSSFVCNQYAVERYNDVMRFMDGFRSHFQEEELWVRSLSVKPRVCRPKIPLFISSVSCWRSMLRYTPNFNEVARNTFFVWKTSYLGKVLNKTSTAQTYQRRNLGMILWFLRKKKTILLPFGTHFARLQSYLEI